MFFLLDSNRLIWHEAWVFLILFVIALIFRASARSVDKDQEEIRVDKLPELIAFFFTSLALDRLLTVGTVILRLYLPQLMDFWITIIHLGLLVLEVSIYILAFYLLKDGIKERARIILKGWLE